MSEQAMSRRRALALAAAAIDYVSAEAPDIKEWQQAAGVVRDMLACERGSPVAGWFWAAPDRTRRKGRKRNAL